MDESKQFSKYKIIEIPSKKIHSHITELNNNSNNILSNFNTKIIANQIFSKIIMKNKIKCIYLYK